MSTRQRKLDVVIGSEAKGDGFKKTGDQADKLKDKLKKSGEQGGKGLKDGVEDGVDKLGDKLKTKGKEAGDKLKSGVEAGASGLQSVGDSASEAFSSGFDFDGLVSMAADAFSGMAGKLGPVAGAAGVATAGAFAVGLMNGMETEVSTDKLAAQLGGSEWAESMGEVAGDLYLQGFGESVADTGDAVRRVVQNGLLPEDATNAQIEELTGRMLTFTDVMEQDMDMATQAVSNMLRTGIAEDGTEAFDILTRGVQQGADRAGDLLETFQEYSTMFRDIGISAEDATGLMVQGLQAGARDADTVADALKEFAIRAQDGSDTSAQGFKDIGLNAKEMTEAVAAGGPKARGALDQVLDGLRNMEDPAERNAAAVALFGTKAEDLGDALFSLDLDSAAAGLGDVAGATDGLGSAYDNASSRIETFKRNALEKLTLFVGEEVLPKLQALGDWAKENPGAFQALAIAVGAFAAAMLAANIAMGIANALTTAWTVIQGIATAAQWLWNAAMYANPIMWVVLAIVALIAIIVLLVIHWDTVKAAAGRAWEFMKEKASAFWGWLKEKASAGKDWIVARWNDVVSFVKGLPGRISSAASGMWDGIKESFRDAINSIIRWWNNLSFPSFTIPSIDPLGSFGPSIGGGTIGGWELPNISQLAEGAIVRHRPGGILANIGEGRHDEAVVPLDGNHGGGDTYYVTEVHVAGSVLSDRDLTTLLKKLDRGGRGLN